MKKKAILIDSSRAIREAIASWVIELSDEEIEIIHVNSFSELQKALYDNPSDIFGAVTSLNFTDKFSKISNILKIKNIPTIVLTAENSIDAREKVLNNGAVDYFSKLNSFGMRQASDALYRLYRNQLKRIVIIDDSITMQATVSSVLENYNYNCICFDNGLLAYEYIKHNNNNDLIITDHYMPEKNGLDFIGELKSNFPDLKARIIGYSETAKKEIASLFLKAGADDYLRKPFCQEELICRVNNNIDLAEHLSRTEILANTDSLTGLYNRRHFLKSANNLLMNDIKYKTHSWCAFIDIDFFKKVNDTYGHQAGDKTINMIASELKSYFNENYIISRFGGEEFVVCGLKEVNTDIHSKLSAFGSIIADTDINYCDSKFNVTVSIGYAETLEQDMTVSTVLKRADEALYISKNNGRNKVTKYKISEAA